MYRVDDMKVSKVAMRNPDTSNIKKTVKTVAMETENTWSSKKSGKEIGQR